ncbi:MAG: trypsin-like peptidase domain-containing protein [Actinomycetota bacterium]|nr:trypsin-like peptidase domain-containing protein [Actinomycetota bacterium]
MTEDGGRHAAGQAADAAAAASVRPDDATFERPSGVDAGFAPRAVEQLYVAPPPTVSPAERALFARPTAIEASAAFAAPANERLLPKHTQNSPLPRAFHDAFGATPDARDGFAPAPGTRLRPAGTPPESPWWKSDAVHDPWRDPSSPFWLGRGAVFSSGTPAQLDADQDIESGDEPMLDEADDEDLDPPDNVRRVRFGLSTLMTVLVVAIIAGAVGGLAGWFLTNSTEDALHRPNVKIAQADTPTKRPAGSVAAIAKKVGPAVVSIAVTTPDQFSIGSGVVIDSDGDVLTNNHVVSAATQSGSKATIIVTFSNESRAKATIVGRDPASDLAVVKVPNTDITVATLGKSSSLAVGDPVVAIGSPLGLQGTVTAGIVSALNRPVHVTADDGTSGAYLNAIQTDAAINPGNSGGALVNGSSAVIGINSAASLGSTGPGGGAAITGIGYAIPIDYARQVALELIHTGKVEHASLGAQGRTVIAPDPAAAVGAYLVQISPGGPAARAGLQAGDTIVIADGQAIESFDQLTVIVQQHKPGDRIGVTYYRKGTSKTSAAWVTLGKG